MKEKFEHVFAWSNSDYLRIAYVENGQSGAANINLYTKY